MTNINSRVAVVAGASSGVGRAVALDLALSGWRVIAIARRLKQLTDLQLSVQEASGDLKVVVADLSDSDCPLPSEVFDEIGQSRELVLIYATGSFGPIGLVGEVSEADWIRTMQTNFLGAVRLTGALLPVMRALGSGRLVYVSSSQTLHDPDPLVTAYATSKVALNYFMTSVAQELVGTDIAAVALHPGDLKTEMWAQIQMAALAAGPKAATFAAWANVVDTTGGDDMAAAVAVVRRALEEPAANVNGQFLLPEVGVGSHGRLKHNQGIVDA